MAFKVPESARVTEHQPLATSAADGKNGAFLLEGPEPGWSLALICSDGSDLTVDVPWDHVSVHAFRGSHLRTPTWKEMAFVKDLCWDAEDVVMQLHPARSAYVNLHPHVLHLWRPHAQNIPLPPVEAV